MWSELVSSFELHPNKGLGRIQTRAGLRSHDCWGEFPASSRFCSEGHRRDFCNAKDTAGGWLMGHQNSTRACKWGTQLVKGKCWKGLAALWLVLEQGPALPMGNTFKGAQVCPDLKAAQTCVSTGWDRCAQPEQLRDSRRPMFYWHNPDTEAFLISIASNIF